MERAKLAWNDTVVEGRRVRIRYKRRDDALDDFRWRRDPEIARYDGNRPLQAGFSDFLRQVEHDLHFADPRRQTFALESPEGVHIGNLMYYNADGESAEIGISIASEEDRGHGAGTEAVVCFVRHLWQTLPARLLYLHTLEWNERARRCFLRAGFEETARTVRDEQTFIRMEARREWWLLWDAEGRFDGAPREEVRPS